MSDKKEQKKQLNKIYVPHGTVSKLKEFFDCSIGFVSDSLNGKKSSDFAIKIREVALKEFEGVEIKPTRKKRKTKND